VGTISGSIPAYTSFDPLVYANLSIANPVPTSILLAFSGTHQPIASLSFPTEPGKLEQFVDLHRHPILTHLTKANYADMMKSTARAIVVLGAVHAGVEGESEIRELEDVARAWRRGGRGFQQPVWFAWVEGDKWSGWLRQAYGIRKSELPTVVVIDTPVSTKSMAKLIFQVSEYYDTTIEGNRVEFDGSSIFSVLEGVYQHFLRPKKSELGLEWSARGAAMTLLNIGVCPAFDRRAKLTFQANVIDHPFWSILGVLGSVAIFVFLLQKCTRDPRADHSAGSRLD
jgi:hypothetical protein